MDETRLARLETAARALVAAVDGHLPREAIQCRADELWVVLEGLDFDRPPVEDEEPDECPRCSGLGVLAQGPYGEEPECRRCGGSGEVYLAAEADRIEARAEMARMDAEADDGRV